MEDSSIPARTLVAAPQVTTVNIGGISILRQVRYQFPPGPSGFVGWRLKYAGSVILPWQRDQWIRGDSMTRDLPVYMEIPSGELTLERYNTDQFSHTVLLVFEVEDVDLRASFRSPFIPVDVLEGRAP